MDSRHDVSVAEIPVNALIGKLAMPYGPNQIRIVADIRVQQRQHVRIDLAMLQARQRIQQSGPGTQEALEHDCLFVG